MYRILGVDNEGGSGLHAGASRNLALYRALGERGRFVDRFTPAIGGGAQVLNYAASFEPHPRRWRHRARQNPRTFRAWSCDARRRLEARRGEFDLILQVSGLFGLGGTGFPVVMYVDNTLAVTNRHYPQWNPMRPRERREWLSLERDAYQASGAVFTMTEYARQSVLHDYGCREDQVVCVGAGTNLPPEPATPKIYDGQVALFVGYEFERKGGRTLLEAWRQVRAALPGAELQIVGPRSNPVPAGQPGVRWLGRINDREQMRDLYRRATLFVLPSIFDPCPHVLREAMACGLPCVSTEQGAIAEIVQHDVTGTLVPVGDPGALAYALTSLLSDPDRAARYGAAGRGAVQTRMGWAQVAERMWPHLERLAATRP